MLELLTLIFGETWAAIFLFFVELLNTTGTA